MADHDNLAERLAEFKAPLAEFVDALVHALKPKDRAELGVAMDPSTVLRSGVADATPATVDAGATLRLCLNVAPRLGFVLYVVAGTPSQLRAARRLPHRAARRARARCGRALRGLTASRARSYDRRAPGVAPRTKAPAQGRRRSDRPAGGGHAGPRPKAPADRRT